MREAALATDGLSGDRLHPSLLLLLDKLYSQHIFAFNQKLTSGRSAHQPHSDVLDLNQTWKLSI